VSCDVSHINVLRVAGIETAFVTASCERQADIQLSVRIASAERRRKIKVYLRNECKLETTTRPCFTLVLLLCALTTVTNLHRFLIFVLPFLLWHSLWLTAGY
jgi:hypothetical protein